MKKELEVKKLEKMLEMMKEEINELDGNLVDIHNLRSQVIGAINREISEVLRG